MTNQEIIDLAAQFDLITFGPQDLIMFAREVEAKTIERCAKVCDDIALKPSNVILGVATDCAAAIRALGDDDE